MTLETEDLLARPLLLEDAPAFYLLTSDPEVARYMRFDTHTSLSQAKALVESCRAEGNRAFAVLEKATGGFAGLFALKADRDDPENMDLTTFFSPQCWNKGYSSRLLPLFIAYARDTLGKRSLTDYVVSENKGSCRVLEKNGFAVSRTLVFDDLPGGLHIYTRAL